MEFRNKREETADNRAADRELYRLLVAGDLPGAWLAAKSQMEKQAFSSLCDVFLQVNVSPFWLLLFTPCQSSCLHHSLS